MPPLAPGDPRHGTINGYFNHVCRCVDCKAAHAERQRELRNKWAADADAGIAVLKPRDPLHGTLTGYRRYKCRCEKCRAANAAQQKAYRDRKAAEAAEQEGQGQ